MQIKTTMRYHRTSVRMAIIKKTRNNKGWEDVEKRESTCTDGGSVNWYSHYRKQNGNFSKKFKIKLLQEAIPLLSRYLKKMKSLK